MSADPTGFRGAKNPVVRSEPSTRLRDLGVRVCELDRDIEADLVLFRAGLAEFAAGWMREHARRIAVSQNQVTLKLGRKRVAELKGQIDDHIRIVPDLIESEFTLERYGQGIQGSSGQVSAVVARQFEQGVRRVLATVYPVLEDSGYARDEHFLDDEPAGASPRPRFAPPFELPPDLDDLVQRIADRVTDRKVVEAKIAAHEVQSHKVQAARLWDEA